MVIPRSSIEVFRVFSNTNEYLKYLKDCDFLEWRENKQRADATNMKTETNIILLRVTIIQPEAILFSKLNHILNINIKNKRSIY